MGNCGNSAPIWSPEPPPPIHIEDPLPPPIPPPPVPPPTPPPPIPPPPAWHIESPFPQGQNLRAITGVKGDTSDKDELLITTDQGGVLRGNQAYWNPLVSIASHSLNGISGNDTFLAVGVFNSAGFLPKLTGRWNDLYPPIEGAGTLQAVWASPNPDEFFVVGTTGQLFVVTNQGSSWVQEGEGVTTDSLFGISGIKNGMDLDVYAVGDNGRIIHRESGVWKVEADLFVSSQLNGVWIQSNTDVFAIGNGGIILHKEAGMWKTEASPTTKHLNAIFGAADTICAVGNQGTLVCRGTDGIWKLEDVGLTTELLTGIWGTTHAGKATFYAVGNVGTILKRENGKWEEISTRVTSNALAAVWVPKEGEAYAVGGDGVIVHRTGPVDNDKWTVERKGDEGQTLNAISGKIDETGQTDVYAVGTSGTILHKTSSGWEYEGGYLTSGELTSVWVGKDSVYVVGLQGRMGRKQQGNWNLIPTTEFTTTENLFAVWGEGEGDNEVVYLAGSNGLLYRHDKTGWTQEAKDISNQNIITLFGKTEQDLYAFGDKGDILHRESGKWTKSTNATFSRYPGVSGCLIPKSDAIFSVSSSGVILQSGSFFWYVEKDFKTPLSGIAASGSKDIYVVGANGYILHYY